MLSNRDVYLPLPEFAVVVVVIAVVLVVVDVALQGTLATRSHVCVDGLNLSPVHGVVLKEAPFRQTMKLAQSGSAGFGMLPDVEGAQGSVTLLNFEIEFLFDSVFQKKISLNHQTKLWKLT